MGKFGEYSVVIDDFRDGENRSSAKVSVFECAGRILSPGFIDIQLNGAFGVDFSNPEIQRDDVLAVANKLPRYGVTHFCPTLISSSKRTYRKMIPLIGKIVSMDKSCSKRSSISGRASLELGMHLEGPFFASSKRGAHAAENICDKLDDNSLESIYGVEVEGLFNKAGVSIITLAPELPGAMDRISLLSKHGVTTSIGHTEANLQDGITAKQCGAKLITHLFNAMRPFHHREPGLLGLLQQNESDDECNSFYYSTIADGLHSHPASVKMAYALSKNIVLVTDAMSAMGLGDGEHSLGSEDVTVKNKRAVIRGTDTLAGSVASMDCCVSSFKKYTGCSHYEAIRAATVNPAKVLGLERKLASVEEGSVANLVILDDGMDVLRTLVGGRIVYSNNEKCPAYREHGRTGLVVPSKRKETA